MADAWVRLAQTTHQKYIKEVEDATLRNFKVFAMMQDRGRQTNNHSGLEFQWPIMFKQAPVQGLSAGGGITFAQRDRWRTARLGWRASIVTDSITKSERLQNNGEEAIVKVFGGMLKRLGKDLTDNYSLQIYNDGNAAGYENSIHGIESFMSVSGAATNGYVGVNNDTYAGLSTALASEGGNWTQTGAATAWPDGSGDAHYDYFTPLVVDYTDGSWTASTKTWPNTCLEAMRYGIIQTSGRNRSKDAQLDMICLDRSMYRQFLDKAQAEERIMVARSDKQSLVSLGFRDVVNFDGIDITSEYGVPAGVGYGWGIDLLQLMSLQDSLFKPDGPYYNESDQSYRFQVDVHGNMRFGNENGGVRDFLKFAAIT